MSASKTDADRIEAQGAPITLTDGRIYHLRYSFRGLLELERRFGSTKAIDESIARILNGDGKAYTDLAAFLAAGLSDNRNDLPDDDTILGLLDPRQMLSYGEAIGLALAEAFPEAVSENGSGKAKRKTSRGVPGTTRGQSSSDEPTKPSGE